MKNYTHLTEWLKQKSGTDVPMSFMVLERILGHPLPPSARKYRAWWSNNPDNNVMTRAWLAAGYISSEVDMAGERLVFKHAPRAGAGQTGPRFEREKAPNTAGQPTGVSDMMAKFDGAASYDWLDANKISDMVSKRALAWLKSGASINDRIVAAVEAAAAREARAALVAKYAGLNIGAGSDSVDLIREDRDGR